MRERSEMLLADLVQIRAEQKPDLDVVTFEHLSLDDGATPDEVRTYADLQTNANRIAAAFVGLSVLAGPWETAVLAAALCGANWCFWRKLYGLAFAVLVAEFVTSMLIAMIVAAASFAPSKPASSNIFSI